MSRISFGTTSIGDAEYTAVKECLKTGFLSPGQYTKKFEPLVLAAYEDDKMCGVLLGVFIHEREGIGKHLSSRFVVYGGPLLTGNSDQQNKCLKSLLKALIIQTKNKALFTQFRNFFSWNDYLDIFEKHGFMLLERMNYIIQIQGAGNQGPGKMKSEIRNPKSEANTRKSVLKNMSEGRSRQITKSLANGAEIIEPENMEQLREFYNILFKLYRYKVRKPLADWSFFEHFYQQTLKSLNADTTECSPGIIRLVKYEGRIIGGILAPTFENKCIYEWYVCGLDKEYKEQYPSVLATWAAIEYAINNNFSCFDFMGVGVPDTPYGVRDFKARFGGELVNYGRLTRINNPFLYNIAELGYNILALLRRI